MSCRTLLAMALLAGAAAGEDAITTSTLLEEMTDLERLATPAAYTCRQWSSYDRMCEKGDPYANKDSGNYLRKEKDEYVLAEAEGPGAIVRIWSADPKGTLKIWLDGRIAVEADFEPLLDGRVAPYREPFGAKRSQGGNLYFPFPYAKSMKVTCDRGGAYYHVNARTWPAGTKVETYARKKLDEDLAERVRVRLRGDDGVRADAVARGIGEELKGPGTIVRLDVTATGARLRECLLRITVDGELAVCCPLPDFFGTAPAAADMRTLPMTVTKEGAFRCRFPIPFERSAKIEIDAADTGAKIEGNALVRPGACGPLRFHAWWRGSNALRTRPLTDWPVLRGEGRGRYVGTTLAVRNPVKEWWGEGDEKITIDGEAFPSTFGTGTEDYFGYAWCDNRPFDAPFHSQSRCDGPRNRGQTAVNRFHILDDIPFSRSIRFDMEVCHWVDCTMGYSTVAYWYAEPGFRLQGFREPDREDMKVVELLPAAGVKGAIEGERMEVVRRTAGATAAQDMDAFGPGWSGGAQVWWTDAKPGESLVLAFESGEEGKRSLAMALTKAPDYGVVRISVNGAVVIESVDLYADAVRPTGEIRVEAELKKGRNELKLEITGTNRAAEPKGYMVGLDYVRIVE
ncbi:MAG: DUF2961 domain-containing protein [Planctomycetes bacterium]|nr:DUF2961 domain-containing protein [Planctomycetota bacterium]